MDEDGRAQLSIFIRNADSVTYKPREEFAFIRTSRTAKTSEPIMIKSDSMFFLKKIDQTKIYFPGLDGVNAMSR